jgi:hypothetical protein
MPYILKKDKSTIDAKLKEVHIGSVGELNYAINALAMNYLNQLDQMGYAELNGVIGAIESAKLEFTRRIVATYEIQKIRENGDIFQEFIRKHNLPTF